MAYRKDGLSIIICGCAKEAHTKDTADEGGGQEEHRQDLNIS